MGGSLAKEAAAWTSGQKTLQGPAGRDHFIIEQAGRFWRLTIHPRKGAPRVLDGLTQAEANRHRQKLSDEGYVGKMVGGG